MSADNGIYILKTQAKNPIIESDFEYRVAHVMGVDNIYYNVDTGKYEEDFIPQEVFRCFGDCQVFVSEAEALLFAHKRAKEYSVLEYGVSILNHPNQVFVPFSEDELEFHEAEIDAIIERHHQKRNAEQVERRKNAAVSFGQGLLFEPGDIYGYLIKEDGTRVHGSLSGLSTLEVIQEGELGEGGIGARVAAGAKDLEFLPSDWNKE